MKKKIVILFAAMMLVGCGVKKIVTNDQSPVTNPEPAWHTCLIQNARVTVNRNGDKLSSPVTMQVVHDSMLVISVTPMFGMEMMRVEATPTELIAINKINGQYAQATYAELNRKLTPALNWDVLQQLCAAELPIGSERARMLYDFGDEKIELVLEYTPRKTDVPVRLTHLPLGRYTKIDITKWL